MFFLFEFSLGRNGKKTLDSACEVYFSTDDDVLTIAHSPKNLAVVTRTGCKLKCISTGENKQVRSSAHGTIIPVREGNGTNELWYTIPYHFQPNSTMNISMVLYLVCTLEKSGKTKIKEERKQRLHVGG